MILLLGIPAGIVEQNMMPSHSSHNSLFDNISYASVIISNILALGMTGVCYINERYRRNR